MKHRTLRIQIGISCGEFEIFNGCIRIVEGIDVCAIVYVVCIDSVVICEGDGRRRRD
jgi:hypothetical protein